MYIDSYEFYEEEIDNHYMIYHPETDDFEESVDGRECEEIYASHVATCIWVGDIPKYDLVDDLSGVKVIYRSEIDQYEETGSRNVGDSNS